MKVTISLDQAYIDACRQREIVAPTPSYRWGFACPIARKVAEVVPGARLVCVSETQVIITLAHGFRFVSPAGESQHRSVTLPDGVPTWIGQWDSETSRPECPPISFDLDFGEAEIV